MSKGVYETECAFYQDTGLLRLFNSARTEFPPSTDPGFHVRKKNELTILAGGSAFMEPEFVGFFLFAKHFDLEEYEYLAGVRP